MQRIDCLKLEGSIFSYVVPHLIADSSSWLVLYIFQNDQTLSNALCFPSYLYEKVHIIFSCLHLRLIRSITKMHSLISWKKEASACVCGAMIYCVKLFPRATSTTSPIQSTLLLNHLASGEVILRFALKYQALQCLYMLVWPWSDADVPACSFVAIVENSKSNERLRSTFAQLYCKYYRNS